MTSFLEPRRNDSSGSALLAGSSSAGASSFADCHPPAGRIARSPDGIECFGAIMPLSSHSFRVRLLAIRAAIGLLAGALALQGFAQDGAAPAAANEPPRAPVPAQPEPDGTDEPEASDEDDGGSTNGAPSLTVPGSTNAPGTNAPGTNAPARRSSRRSSRRSPERTGIADWRPSSRSGSSSSPKAASTNGPATSDYAYFQVVNDRNIFNSSRVPNRPDRPRSTEARRAPKVESVSLVGTLRYEKGVLAFFDGTSSDYKKALKPGDTVAGHRIVSVTDSTVRLVVQDGAVDLKVGNQLRREDEGDWKLADGVTLGASSSTGVATPSSSSASTNAPSTTQSAASSGSSGGGAEEILRRLRERRAQENKK